MAEISLEVASPDLRQLARTLRVASGLRPGAEAVAECLVFSFDDLRLACL
jgi:hypothetical protein